MPQHMKSTLSRVGSVLSLMSAGGIFIGCPVLVAIGLRNVAILTALVGGVLGLVGLLLSSCTLLKGAESVAWVGIVLGLMGTLALVDTLGIIYACGGIPR